MQSFVNQVQQALVTGAYKSTYLIYFIDTDVSAPVGSPILASASAGMVSRALYILGPNVPSSYANLQAGNWTWIPGATRFQMGNLGTSQEYASITDVFGQVWYTTAQMTSWTFIG